MKKILVSLFCLLGLAAFCQEYNFEKIFYSDDFISAVYIDLDSFENKSGYYYYNAYFHYKNDAKPVVKALKTDCVKKKTAVLNYFSYDSQKESFDISYRKDSSYFKTADGAEYAIQEKVCASDTIKNIKTPKTAGSNLQTTWGPYMRALERKIKDNWRPPKNDSSKRVVCQFTILKNGSLDKINVTRSSGNKLADKAALAAIELSQPFQPLPKEFEGDKVEIEFTFDYNVFGGSYNLQDVPKKSNKYDVHPKE